MPNHSLSKTDFQSLNAILGGPEGRAFAPAAEGQGFKSQVKD